MKKGAVGDFVELPLSDLRCRGMVSVVRPEGWSRKGCALVRVSSEAQHAHVRVP